MPPNPWPPLEVVIGRADDAQPPLPLASDGVQRWVWHSRFGEMLIEVAGDEVFVNGQRVHRHGPGPAAHAVHAVHPVHAADAAHAAQRTANGADTHSAPPGALRAAGAAC